MQLRIELHGDSGDGHASWYAIVYCSRGGTLWMWVNSTGTHARLEDAWREAKALGRSVWATAELEEAEA